MHTPSARLARLCDTLQLSYRLVASAHDLLADLKDDFHGGRVCGDDLIAPQGAATSQELATLAGCFEHGAVLFFDEWEDPRALEIEDPRDVQVLLAHVRRELLIAERTKRVLIALGADGSMRIRDLRAVEGHVAIVRPADGDAGSFSAQVRRARLAHS